MMPITVTLDMSRLNRGIEESGRYSRRTTPELVNTAAYWVAVNAKAGMPFVTAERVDTEMGTIVSPVIGVSGKVLKRPKFFSSGKKVSVRGSGGGAAREVPLAAMIVAARAKAGSKYNQLTNNRYALSRNPFKGFSRSLGAQKMAALVNKMIASRHSSGRFLMAGWIPVVQGLRPYTAQRFLRGGASASEGSGAFYGGELGRASAAKEGERCTAVIENDVGGQGENAVSMNRALLQYGSGPLQAALDGEGTRMIEYGLRKMEAELAERVNREWK
jgi:hypothetical protein